jgi:hypothetical protein
LGKEVFFFSKSGGGEMVEFGCETGGGEVNQSPSHTVLEIAEKPLPKEERNSLDQESGRRTA